jgi:Ca-activated chloride channel family protein
MTFAHPYFLVFLAALPLFAWWKRRRAQQAAFLYSSTQLVKEFAEISRWSPARILALLRWAAFVLLIFGMARLQFVESETTVRASGIDIVAVIDLSTSMAAEDRGFTVRGEQANRLEVAKDVLKKFVDKRPNDRIGLVAFAGNAYIAAPLTLDHAFLLQNIERLEFSTIPEDGTAIGSGLSAAINRLREVKSKSKIVILMTDGQNNAGKIPPLTAAEAAQALNVKVYTIGVGTRGMGRMPVVDQFGKRYRPIPVDIDEKTLTAMAEKTGGKYYRADSTDTLRRIYDEIDKLERTEVETKKYVQVKELFPWTVIPGLILLVSEILLGNTVWRKLP